MIQSMKKCMLEKLSTRYSAIQEEYLTSIAYLDPRFKGSVEVNVTDLKSRVKTIYEQTGSYIVGPTQNQELENITNPRFATPIASTSRSSSEGIPSQTQALNFNDLYSDDTVDVEVSDINQLEEKIQSELNLYQSTRLTREQKINTDLLVWWKDHKSQFPCLFQAAKALLHTLATSVPSERIFSEAGYIARARRSKILPVNLNRYIFIKRNLKYTPDFHKYITKEIAEEALSQQ